MSSKVLQIKMGSDLFLGLSTEFYLEENKNNTIVIGYKNKKKIFPPFNLESSGFESRLLNVTKDAEDCNWNFIPKEEIPECWLTREQIDYVLTWVKSRLSYNKERVLKRIFDVNLL